MVIKSIRRSNVSYVVADTDDSAEEEEEEEGERERDNANANATKLKARASKSASANMKEGAKQKKKRRVIKEDSGSDFEDGGGEEEDDEEEEEEEEDEVVGLDEEASVGGEEQEVEGSVIAEEVGGDDPEEEEEEEEEVKVKSVAKKRAPAKKKSKGDEGKPSKGREIDENLPPLCAIADIFNDMVTKCQEDLVKVAKKLKGRKLRVGTMCSGTESPLLALRLISKALKNLTGYEIEVDHVYSCEIEPFKQAYIERNFAPPILFRDVCELDGRHARTAYGGYADVPGDLDILIAGTSCVDYSGLNNKKKSIDEGGESGMTFHGMLGYVKNNQPKIVLLENVCSAPWPDVVQKFSKAQYHATSLRLDTKQFYIPHTRMRGYLVAYPKTVTVEDVVTKTPADLPERWESYVTGMTRPASVSLEAFLLHGDDARLHRARGDLSFAQELADGGKRAPTEWARCQSRHSRARKEEALGNRRPLTDWQDGGSAPKIRGGGWDVWAATQTERVLDLMDISALRSANTENGGVDISYKSAVWNLSQNVDRSTGSTKVGICPCLTPTMIPYVANRRGPIIGLEALALQGLPVEELLLTRESEAQLADLAGNAMSSTVVGAAIISALIAGLDLLVAGDTSDDIEMVEADPKSLPVDDRIRGQEHLSTMKLDLVSCDHLTSDIFDLAIRSSRKCNCEGRERTSTAPILECTTCGFTTCKDCAGRPEHTLQSDDGMRVSPAEFEAAVIKLLPMRFSLEGFDSQSLSALVERESELPLDTKIMASYVTKVSESIQDNEFHFREMIRKEAWIVSYAAPHATLELHFISPAPEWRLFVTADSNSSVNDPLRIILNHSVARLVVSKSGKSLLDGQWDIRLPLSPQELEVTFTNGVSTTPSWQSKLGLEANEKDRWATEVVVEVSDEVSSLLDRSIAGRYTLEEQCDTANSALHRRIAVEDDINLAPLYLFMDPSRSGLPDSDGFVFSQDPARKEYGETRLTVAAVNPTWRPSSIEGSQSVKIIVSWKWIALDGSKMAGGVDTRLSTYSLPTSALTVTAAAGACSYAEAVLTARVDTSVAVREGLTLSNEWEQVDLLHQSLPVFEKVAWVLARVPALDAISDWQVVSLDNDDLCASCCPAPPAISWIRNKAGSRIALEDGVQAGKFEQALKARPLPIIVQLRQVDDTSSEFRIGLNIATLAHKAVARLPQSFSSYAVGPAITSWRLVEASTMDLGFSRQSQFKFKLTDNRPEQPAKQPPGFKATLRPEQLRSLTWMISQETNAAPWYEEEVEEASLRELGWHAEAKATREVAVKGGVLADEVGYGKTAIVVGLICAMKSKIVVPKLKDRIAIKATLVILPGHLMNQWPSEIEKFAGKSLKYIKISNAAHLKKFSIADFKAADVIIVTSDVFNSNVFLPNAGDFAAATRTLKLDKSGGRFFRFCLDVTTAAVGAQVERLRDTEQGPDDVYKAIKKARKDRAAAEIAEEEDQVAIQKRLKGAAYHNANESKAAAKPAKPVKAPKEVKIPPAGVNPWELDTKEVEKDYNEMMNPSLFMFSFNRIVIDEYTYLEGGERAIVLALRADSRWILSGTPPLKTFAEIKTIASLLHVHLGVDDDGENKTKAGKARTKDQTAAERFHSFRDVHSAAWHEHRDRVAQSFLDQFARQNLAEINEIVCTQELDLVRLPPAEMAIYCELEHHLLSLDQNLVKIAKVAKKTGGDREVRLAEALGDSATPEESLLKRCSHFSLDLDEETAGLKDAHHVCQQILDKRSTQLADCIRDLTETLKIGAAMHNSVVSRQFGLKLGGKNEVDRPLLRFVNDMLTTVGDGDVETKLAEIAAEAGCSKTKIQSASESTLALPAYKKWIKLPSKGAEAIGAILWELRDVTHDLRRLTKELVGRVRSERYFRGVRNIQLNPPEDRDTLSILSCCGHEGPTEEIQAAVRIFSCINPRCDAAVRDIHVVAATSLGVEVESGQFGIKIERVVDILNTIPKADRIIVFVQFPALVSKLVEAFETNKIPCISLAGSSQQRSKQLSTFQDETSKNVRVLLLIPNDASSSGANLTIANWAIFVNPLLTTTNEAYKAYEAQAIGRLRRFGQLKPVKILRMLTDATIDVKIFEERSGLNVSRAIVEQQQAGDYWLKCVKDGNRVPQTTKKGTMPEKKAVVSKGKGKANVVESEEEDTAEESEKEVVVKKKVVDKKGKGRAIVVDSDSECVAVDTPPVASTSKSVVKPSSPVTKIKSAPAQPTPSVSKPVTTIKDSATKATSTSGTKSNPAGKTNGSIMSYFSKAPATSKSSFSLVLDTKKRPAPPVVASPKKRPKLASPRKGVVPDSEEDEEEGVVAQMSTRTVVASPAKSVGKLARSPAKSVSSVKAVASPRRSPRKSSIVRLTSDDENMEDIEDVMSGTDEF